MIIINIILLITVFNNKIFKVNATKSDNIIDSSIMNVKSLSSIDNCVNNFHYDSADGTTFRCRVPDGVTSITVDLAGGEGGSSTSSKGGKGGRVVTDIKVDPGEVLCLVVGGAGKATKEGGPGGANGGGRGGNNYGGGGGGASHSKYNDFYYFYHKCEYCDCFVTSCSWGLYAV